MNAKDVMTTGVIIVQSTDPVLHAAKLMYRHNVGALPVFSGDQAVGILTDRDITVRVVAHRLDPASTEVGEVMTAGIVTCREEDDIDEIARTMEYRRIRRVPVRDGEGRIVGIISLSDIAVRGSACTAADVVKDVAVTSDQLPPFRW